MKTSKVYRVKFFFQKAKIYLAAVLAVISISALFGENADAQCRYPVKFKMKLNPISAYDPDVNTNELKIIETVPETQNNVPAIQELIAEEKHPALINEQFIMMRIMDPQIIIGGVWVIANRCTYGRRGSCRNPGRSGFGER